MDGERSNERGESAGRTIAIVAAIAATVLLMWWVLLRLQFGMPTPVTDLLGRILHKAPLHITAKVVGRYEQLAIEWSPVALGIGCVLLAGMRLDQLSCWARTVGFCCVAVHPVCVAYRPSRMNGLTIPFVFVCAVIIIWSAHHWLRCHEPRVRVGWLVRVGEIGSLVALFTAAVSVPMTWEIGCVLGGPYRFVHDVARSVCLARIETGQSSPCWSDVETLTSPTFPERCGKPLPSCTQTRPGEPCWNGPYLSQRIRGDVREWPLRIEVLEDAGQVVVSYPGPNGAFEPSDAFSTDDIVAVLDEKCHMVQTDP